MASILCVLLSMLSAGANFGHFVHMPHGANVNIDVCSMWAAEIISTSVAQTLSFAFVSFQYNLSSIVGSRRAWNYCEA